MFRSLECSTNNHIHKLHILLTEGSGSPVIAFYFWDFEVEFFDHVRDVP